MKKYVSCLLLLILLLAFVSPVYASEDVYSVEYLHKVDYEGVGFPKFGPNELFLVSVNGNIGLKVYFGSTDTVHVSLSCNGSPITDVIDVDYFSTVHTALFLKNGDPMPFLPGNYSISQYDSNGNLIGSSEPFYVGVVPEVVPSEVLGLSITPVSETSVLLEWSANASYEGVISYNVYLDGVLHESVGGTSLTISGLTTEEHTFTVSAVNVVGEGPLSAEYVVDLTPVIPGVVENFTFDLSSDVLTLTWDVPLVGFPTSYIVYLDSELYATISDTSIVISDLLPGSYEFKVSAVSSAGEGALSDPLYVTVAEAVTVPDVVTGIFYYIHGYDVSLSWNSVEGATSYNVYVDGILLESGLTSNRYTFTGMVEGEDYSFYITAVNSAGESEPSKIVVVNLSDSVFGGTELDLGISMADIFGGIGLFIGQFWHLIAFSIALSLSFVIGRRLIRLGRK